MDFIKKHLDKDWNWEQISCNPNLTMEMINKYPNKDWDWNKISSNKKKIQSMKAVFNFFLSREILDA
jgi:uncharacterized protein YlzI (FlbEa/FlbD family)